MPLHEYCSSKYLLLRQQYSSFNPVLMYKSRIAAATAYIPGEFHQYRLYKIIFYFFRFYVIIALESGWLVHSYNLQLISFFIPSLSFHFKIFFQQPSTDPGFFDFDD